ncbi:radical SAM protein [Alkalihalophilus pseudofirmus]|uniref:radical SAM/SPASM domain-containing protein n=1 Tax=Alkalihalophilus pseudofirmus TaxID=79885 RepID=UPI00259BAB30|nr:radical SAM protein [Alkalihalophilus pseudofirmus]WEG16688.1 radical SAM protein [Alkalihalophilus pseudofirmus]
MVKIPYQINDGGLVGLIPTGKVHFFEETIQPLLDEVNNGTRRASSINYQEYMIDEPLVDLDKFHLSAPAIAFIETTNLCNLRCKHCYANSALKRPNEMSTDLIKDTIDQLAEVGVLQLFLSGGEIFAHKDAVEIINYARTKPFYTQIFTNGMLITEEKLKALTPNTSFFISFDTADPERTIRGGMDFPKLREKFELMKKYGHAFRTAISVHRYNLDDAEEIFEWCVNNGYPRPQWLETHPIGRALLHPDILLQPEHISKSIDIYKRCMDKFSKPEYEAPPKDESKEASRMFSLETIKFCQKLERATNQEKCGRSIAYINSAGDVYPCSNCMSNEDFMAGNLREHSFADIWSGGFDEFRNITFEDFKSCQSCAVYQEDIWCQFRCPPLAKNVSKDKLGCGATEYLQIFMIEANRYWEQRKQEGYTLKLEMHK